jgi:hypothetical protein
MKYKVGDKVRVRKDLKVGERYGVYFNEDMAKFIGEEVTIDHAGPIGYRIKEERWNWTDEMFEEYKYNYKKGTKLRRINYDFILPSGRTIMVGEIVTLGKDIHAIHGGYMICCTEEHNSEYVGDIENYEEVKEDIMDAVMSSIYNSKLKYEYKILPFVSNPLCRPISYIEAEGGNQMTDIETLKSFNPKNLSEGKRQAEEEKANYEASEAKKYYTALINQKEELERIIKTTNEELKKVKESLAVFK